MNRCIPLFILCIAVWLPLSGQRPDVEKIHIPGLSLDNIYRIDEGVYRSEQPNVRDFSLLEAYGIREVLSLRFWHGDYRKARNTSLQLHHLKVHAHSLREYEVMQALQIIRNRKGPILIHCWHGSDRTGAVVAMYRIVFQNVSKEAAIEELRNGGFGFHTVFGNIVRMIENADVEKIRHKLELSDPLPVTEGI